jgi:hypothetical protein
MRRLLATTAAITALLVATIALPHAASAAVTQNIRFPITTVGFVPCALGGAGEDVQLAGTAHVVVATTTEGQGRTHLIVTANLADLHGTGLVSGDRYVGASATHETHDLGVFSGAFVSVITESVELVGQGPGNNARLLFRFHVTVDANGVLRVDTYDLEITCR